MIKKIILALSLVVLGGLVYYINTLETKQQQREQVYNQKEELCRPYYTTKRELEKQLETLKKEYEKKKAHKGTTQLVFTELDPMVYEQCYPIMKEYGFVGVLAFSQTEYPGAEGCMSVEQFQELKNAGWTVCVRWDVSSASEVWFPIVKQKAEELGVELGQMMYFPIGTYNLTLDAQVEQMGFSIILCNEEDTDVIVRPADEPGIWHLTAVGFMSAKPKTWLIEAVAQKGNIAYLIGFELEHEKYVETSFASMLGYFQAYQETNELQVSNAEDAREHYRGRLTEREQILLQEYEQEKSVLEVQLSEVMKKIEEIKNQ